MTKKQQLNYNQIASGILAKYKIIYTVHNFYYYENGCYKVMNEEKLKKWIKEEIKDGFTIYTAKEITNSIKAEAYIDAEKLNQSNLLNVKNGMLNLETFQLLPHSPEYYSTTQLNITYIPEAKCNKWVKTLNEIFERNKDKICLLQEYFGLCLTKETKYEKALIMIGEGSNGKSVILYVLGEILGKRNRSAIPLEKFSNRHYLANLFGRLININIETNVKSSVYDSTFKAIVTGDSIEADSKFKPPFSFEPFCKMIFALNNMPRADDKSHAFYRRLLILRFNKEFAETEQNKTLKYELVKEERDGIFIWMLEGLRRLRERDYFQINKEMLKEIEEYRRENNNVLVFVDEICILDKEKSLSKTELYERYKNWCIDSGFRPLGKYKFGRELIKQYSEIEDSRIDIERRWQGIGWR